jgi:ATP synthase protein I
MLPPSPLETESAPYLPSFRRSENSTAQVVKGSQGAKDRSSPEISEISEIAKSDDTPVNSELNADTGMQEFYQLQQNLYGVTLLLTGVIFTGVWIVYSRSIALNYLIGAVTGVIYLKMLARDVESFGPEKPYFSKTRFALFIGVMVVAAQWQLLKILPIFLGFLTYKATLIIYTMRIALLSDLKASR